MDSDDDVRPADKVICERLLDPPSIPYEWEDQMDKVIQTSIVEYEAKQTAEKAERETHFPDSKKTLARLSHLDKANHDLYSFGLSSILMYEEGILANQEVPAEFRDRFMTMLSKTRLPTKEIERWETFLLRMD
jgi:hypothetical protein